MSTTHQRFDLFSFIKAIHSPEIAAQAAQSTAWKVDTLITRAAGQLHNIVRDDLYDAGIDERAELTNALNEAAYAEESFHEIGSAVTGPVATIKELHYVREAWHNLAAELTPLTLDYKGVPRQYVEKSLDDQIFNPGNMKVNTDTARKMKVAAKRTAEAFDAPELAEGLYQRKLERKAEQLVGIKNAMKSKAQGISYMLSLALAHPMEMPEANTTAMFESLTLSNQRELINNAINAINREIDRACDDKNMSERDYDVMYVYGLKLIGQLRSVLKSTRFVNDAQQTAAAETNLG
jgi:hypothetical protein